MRRRICWILMLFLSSQAMLFANYFDRVNLEKSYTEKVQDALDGVYGKGNFVARVTVQLGKESWSVKYTEQSKVKLNNKSGNKKGGDQILILPGYPVIKNLSPDELTKLPFNSTITKNPPKIRKIIVDLIVNKAFPKSQARKSSKIINKVLDINPKRGDKINMDFQVFMAGSNQQPTQNVVITDRAEKLFSFGNILNIMLLLFVLIGIAVYAVFQFLMLKKSGGEKEGGGGPNISVNPNIELPKGGGGPGGNLKLSTAPPVKQYFDFIQEDNFHKLMYIIEKEKMSDEDVSIIISFLESSIGSQLLAEFDLERQAIIGMSIIDQKLLQRTRLEKLENKIKDSLECLTGGKTKFKGIFDYISSDIKKQILGVLGKSDADGYKKFRQNVVIFEDIKFLEDEELKTILSDANLDMLSKSLIGVEKDVYQKVDSNLNDSAKSMIDQFMKLKGKTVSKSDVDKSQAYVLDIVLKLEAEGKVKLQEKIKK